MKILLTATLFGLLAGCSLPQTTVRTGAATPSLSIHGAPPGAQLFVDGLAAGTASQYNGSPKVFAVLEGVHRVEIRQGSTVLYQEKIFVSSGENHAIDVIPGAAR